MLVLAIVLHMETFHQMNAPSMQLTVNRGTQKRPFQSLDGLSIDMTTRCFNNKSLTVVRSTLQQSSCQGLGEALVVSHQHYIST